MQIKNKNEVNMFSYKDNIWKGIMLTNSAAKQINKLLAQNDFTIGIFLGIKKSGCANFSYYMKKITKIKSHYIMYEHNNAKLYVSVKEMPFIDGTKIDYLQDGLNNSFKFINPKIKSTCGCGDSFNF